MTTWIGGGGGVERFVVNWVEGKMTMMMMVIRVYEAREGVGQPLLVIDLLQFWKCSIYTFQHGFTRSTGDGHGLKVQAYTAAHYTPSAVCPLSCTSLSVTTPANPSLQFEYTHRHVYPFVHLIRITPVSFTYCTKNWHTNVLDTFLRHNVSRTYCRIPDTSVAHED
jgi:hypothetical protein